MDFFRKNDYSTSDIENLIKIKAEESIHLEFKSSESLGYTDSRRAEIAKDVSAFANSDGGVIVYGISEKDHCAESLSFIDGNEFGKEWLEQIISSRIQKRIPDLTITPVRFDNDILKTVYVVKIPQSHLSPHMSSDKRYYRRFNFQSIAMEEYEVRDLFSRRQRTEIEIGDVLIVQKNASFVNGAAINYVHYLLRFQVHNTGQTIEDRLKLEIYIPKSLMRAEESSEISKYKIRDDDDISVYSIPYLSPIYQSEITTVTSGVIRVSGDTLAKLSNPGIRLKLFYSSGIKERAFNLLPGLTFKSKFLVDHRWS